MCRNNKKKTLRKMVCLDKAELGSTSSTWVLIWYFKYRAKLCEKSAKL